MTLNIELVEPETQTVMYIRTRTSFADMPKLIGESYCKIAAGPLFYGLFNPLNNVLYYFDGVSYRE